eukprot:TRINITY_DN6259_c0_g1_i4.p1 TRINITY_DN6259_c0_g1~~TRINITY_DN6259_c0_g1_i4.p1  ORF type:complete len:1216 (-),score=131.62 TRINITY_DN6259_c0_g1_i4:53-3700(-)
MMGCYSRRSCRKDMPSLFVPTLLIFLFLLYGIIDNGIFVSANLVGVFQTNVGSGCTACYKPFPETGSCACPSGSAKVDMNVISACRATLTAAKWSSCYNTDSGDAFKGLFERDDYDNTCLVPNPLTGSCSCPQGSSSYQAFFVLELYQGLDYLSRVEVCYQNSRIPWSTFGGMYMLDDPHQYAYGCSPENPFTGACSCPPGTLPQTLRVKSPGTDERTPIDSSLVICQRKSATVGSCALPLTTLTNCGSCNTPCSRANAAASCSSGSCAILACNIGYDNCDATDFNGCETQLNSLQHCGACNAPCARANAAATCSSGACAIVSCNSGFANCNADGADGCETSLTSINNCGACNVKCNPPHGTGACSGSGACSILSCNQGWMDCDGDVANGCETLLNSTSNCGACGARCEPLHSSPICEAGSGGGCTHDVCDAGWQDCDGNEANGCERDIRTLSDCGGCNVECNRGNATVSCATGTCIVSSCSEGYASCNPLVPDGCETSLNSFSNCGACGMNCSRANAVSSCYNGTCILTSCNEGFDDCDGIASNGCERDLRTTSDCGACDVRCSLGNTTSTICSPTTRTCEIGSCNAAHADCDGIAANGCERSVRTTTDCGECGVTCEHEHASTTCDSGECAIVTCDANYGNCDGILDNGCERSLLTTTDCGACNSTCSLGHSTSSCSTGICVIDTCEILYGDCDGSVSTGCETSLTSLVDCGACGVSCSYEHGSASCATGQCALLSCDAAWLGCFPFNCTCPTVIPAPPAYCGDGICDRGVSANETCITCPEDCLLCPASCPGNGTCSGHGQCNYGQCDCEGQWTGPSCEYSSSPIAVDPTRHSTDSPYINGGVIIKPVNVTTNGTSNNDNSTSSSGGGGAAAAAFSIKFLAFHERVPGGSSPLRSFLLENITFSPSSINPMALAKYVIIDTNNNNNNNSRPSPRSLSKKRSLRSMAAITDIYNNQESYTTTSQASNNDLIWVATTSLGNGTVLIQLQQFTESRVVSFAGLNSSVPANTLKCSIWIRNYTFAESTNELTIVMQNQAVPSTVVDSSDDASPPSSQQCATETETDTRPTQQSNQAGNLLWSIVRGEDGATLYTTFSSVLLVDGKPRVAQTRTAPDDQIVMVVPFFQNDAVLDPNFNILIDPQSRSNHLVGPKTSGTSCGNQLQGGPPAEPAWRIPVIATAVAVFGAAIIAIVIFEVRRRRKKNPRASIPSPNLSS